MQQFILRLAVFIALWVFLIARYSDNMAISLFFFAFALGLYFLLSLNKLYISVYYVLAVLIALHGMFMTEESLVTMLLMTSVAAVAAYRMEERPFHGFVAANAVVMTTINILQSTYWLEWTAAGLFLMLMTLALNRAVHARDEQAALYEGLLSEYQRLKRQNMNADRTVRLEERARIAREIHDSVGHRLTSLIMKLEMLSIQKGDAEYQELKQLAENGLKETRQAVRTLQSEEQEGMATVIHLIRKLEAESHIAIQLTIKEGVLSVPLLNTKSVVLYRTLQEALTNAMRHGQTREVRMVLGKSAIGEVSFEVANTYYATKPFSFGFGLRNMKSRLEETGGRLDVHQTDTEFVVSGTMPGDE